MTDPDHDERLPALAVACPSCGSTPDQLCTSHGGTRTRRHDVHQTRTQAHRALVDSIETELTGGCGVCDTEADEMCVGCGGCRCDRHDTCTRPTP
ncbi:hypothetical protein AB0I93_26920 [Streptomyces sp. NPDC049967]|uniref:zinc finger domain-containing protein n=1 Tax=Streptomyces sp. NPDC049967 TaxID=3155658 RepID=UPI0034175DD4